MEVDGFLSSLSFLLESREAREVDRDGPIPYPIDKGR
jgi:hypothetical protein